MNLQSLDEKWRRMTTMLGRKRVNKKKTQNHKSKKMNQVQIFRESTPLAEIDKLDNDCLAKIFLCLPMQKRLKLEQVCTRWRDVCQELAWDDIKILQLGSLRKIPYIPQILHRCARYLTNLEFEYFLLPGKNIVKSFGKMHQLKSITMNYIKPSTAHNSEDFHESLIALPETIEEIHLNGSLAYLNYWEIAELPEYVVRCDYFIPTPEIFEKTIEKFYALRCLTLNRFFLGKDAMRAISRMKTLVNLDLASCRITDRAEFYLSDLHGLENLNLADMEFDDSLISMLANQCNKISVLDISYASGATKRGLMELTKMENLEVLKINRCYTDICDIRLGQFLKLKKLECRDSMHMCDADVIRLLNSSPKLELLDVSSTSVTAETLIFARHLTNRRINNIILKIIVDADVIEDFDVLHNVSPFLIIELD